MAVFGITECMARLKDFPEKVADRAVEEMKYQINTTTNGPGDPVHLVDTVKKEKMADGTYTVSTNKFTTGKYAIREVGAIIRKGRPALVAKHDIAAANPRIRYKYAHALRFPPPVGYTGPVGKDGMVYRHSVGPAKPNDFVQRTKDALEKVHWTL